MSLRLFTEDETRVFRAASRELAARATFSEQDTEDTAEETTAAVGLSSVVSVISVADCLSSFHMTQEALAPIKSGLIRKLRLIRGLSLFGKSGNGFLRPPGSPLALVGLISAKNISSPTNRLHNFFDLVSRFAENLRYRSWNKKSFLFQSADTASAISASRRPKIWPNP